MAWSWSLGSREEGFFSYFWSSRRKRPDLVQTRSSFPGLLGGKEEVEEVKVDVSYEEVAKAWAHYLLGGAMHYLRQLVGSMGGSMGGSLGGSMGGSMGGREDDQQIP